MLELWDAAADSAVQRHTLAYPSATVGWTVGLSMAGSIMPTLSLSRWARLLRRPGPLPDLSALRGRDSSAIASFVRGEGAYRRAQFRDAFAFDSAAVARDTTFALAALRGAQAASWIGRYTQARTLIDVALRHGAAFSARYVAFAEGLDAYLAAQPDSAIRHFRRAIAFDPRWGEAWMALGEAYSHYAPREAPLDSLAEAAVTEARRWDPGFTPPLYDLVQFAVRRGDIGNARALMREFQASNPDSVELVSTELMLRCVEGSLDAVAWRRWAEQRPPLVIEAARMLTVGGLRQPRCAEAAWRAVLDHDTGVTNRWGALQGLQSVLVAEGRYAEVRDLLDRSEFVGPRTRLPLAIFDLWAGAPMGREGARAADSLRAAYRAKPDSTRDDKLWYLGLWEAWRRSADAVRLLADSLGARAARTADAPAKASTQLMAQSLAAHAALARGDTVAALPLLEALAPTAHKSRLLWNPWESLGPERLLLAQLRLARGDYEGAARDASYFDSPAAIPLAASVSAGLEIRIRAAQAMHRDAVIAGLERRLAALRSAAP
jgi:Flp pilus assembly protein TadD